MFEPTPSQSDAIKTRGSVLVTAAAGSGKTAVLVERVINMLCDKENPCSVDRLLIVTFTNAAAAEMRLRLEKRIAEELEHNPANAHLARQKLLLPSAAIGTIDSFCIGLVRDNFEHFSLSPDFKTVDNSELAPLYDTAMRAVLAEYYKNDNERTVALLDALGSIFDDSNLSEAIRMIFDYSRNMPFPERWLRRCREMYLHPRAHFDRWREYSLYEPIKSLKKALIRVEEAAKLIPLNSKLEKYTPLFTAGWQKLKDICAALERDRSEAYALCADFNFEALKGGYKGPAVGEVRSSRAAAVAAVNAFYDAMGADDETALYELERVAPVSATLIEMTERFSEVLTALMREKNTLTFFNTEQMALELLCEFDGENYNMSERAKELSMGFDEILVDEYQDTNDLQDTLFYLLSDNGTKLFSVGDVKQSIYGFRGANPENFVIKKESYVPLAQAQADDRKKIVLSSNFRSRKGVCDFVNYFFSLLMSKNFGGVDYNEEEVLHSAAKFPENDAPAAEIHFIESDVELDTLEDEEELDTEKVEESEARHIAAYIRKSVGKATPLRDGESMRPSRYSDFAILLRSPGKHSGIYLEELKKLGIPARFELSGFLESTEVSAALALLRVINNPTHDVPLLTLMMSPVFGLSAEQVATIRLAGRGSVYSALLTAGEKGDKNAENVLCKIREWRRVAVTMSVDRLVSMLYDDTGLFDMVCALSDGARRRNNLLLFSSFAADYSASGGDLRGFINYIEKVGSSVKSPAGSGGDDAVTIVSFHGSKGLQYPICLIAGAFRPFNKSDTRSRVVCDRDLGIAFKYIDKAQNRSLKTVARKAISKSIECRTLAEELRIMYVAMTRAEEKLVIVLSEKNHPKKLNDIAKGIKTGEDLVTTAKGYYQWFAYALLKKEQCRELRNLAGADFADEQILPDGDCFVALRFGARDAAASVLDEHITVTDRTVDREELLKRFNFVYPYNELSRVASKTSVSEIVHSGVDGNSFKGRPAFLSKAGLTPAQRGTATHKFMQFADYDDAAQDLSKELSRLVESEFLTAAEAAAVEREELVCFFKGPLFERMQKACDLHREMRFLSELPINELYKDITVQQDEKTVVQGVIDCVIEEEDGVSVLDFKTDRVSDEAQLVERYGRQLEIYAAACEKIFGKPVKEKLIYSFSLGRVINV